MPFRLTLALPFLLGAYTHGHIISICISFVPNLGFLLQNSTSPAPCLQSQCGPCGLPGACQIACLKRHIFGGWDGKGLEYLFPPPNNQAFRSWLGEMRRPCTGTNAGGCRTSLMVQKKPGMERRLHSMGPNFTQGMEIGLEMGIPTTQV